MGRIIPGLFDVDIVTILIAYLLVHYRDMGATVFAFGQGLLIDILSAAPLGLFAALYFIIFLSIKFGSRFFDLLSIRGQIIIIILAVLLREFVFVIVLNLFSFEIIVSPSLIFTFVSSAVCSGLAAPLLFYLFNLLNQFLSGGVRAVSEERI